MPNLFEPERSSRRPSAFGARLAHAWAALRRELYGIALSSWLALRLHEPLASIAAT